MAYEIHIERQTTDGQHIPVALDEWRAAVEAAEGVRLAEGALSVTNPKTGEVISFGDEGEVYE